MGGDIGLTVPGLRKAASGPRAFFRVIRVVSWIVLLRPKTAYPRNHTNSTKKISYGSGVAARLISIRPRNWNVSCVAEFKS